MEITTILALIISITWVTASYGESEKKLVNRPTLEEKRKICAEGTTTQLENNMCAGLEFEKWDEELNRLYQQIMKAREKEKVFLEKMRVAQRSWILFRDAELEAIYPPEKSRGHGSSYGMCYFTWKTILTKERIRQLRKWIDGFTDDIPKEDICGGTLLPRPDKRVGPVER